MKNLSCICGNENDYRVIFEQNFTEEMLNRAIFSARGEYYYNSHTFHYRILQCNICSQLFSSPILENNKIGNLYKESCQNYTDETANIIRSYLKPLKNNIHQLNEKKSCLEVGCGSGFFLEAIEYLGFNEIIGVEPSTHAVSQAKSHIKTNIKNCLFEDTSFSDNSMNLICAFQVFDHFVDPLQVAYEFYRILKPGGLCYVIIHSVKAIHVKILREKSPIIDVSHIYYFDKKTINKLLRMVGFEIIDNFNIWNRYTLDTWLRMAPMPFKNILKTVFGLTRINNISLSIPAGNIGIIAKKL